MYFEAMEIKNSLQIFMSSLKLQANRKWTAFDIRTFPIYMLATALYVIHNGKYVWYNTN